MQNHDLFSLALFVTICETRSIGRAVERIVTIARGRAESAPGDPEHWRERIANRLSGRPSEPDEVARIVAMLASPAAPNLPGTMVDLDGGQRHRG